MSGCMLCESVTSCLRADMMCKTERVSVAYIDFSEESVPPHYVSDASLDTTFTLLFP